MNKYLPLLLLYFKGIPYLRVFEYIFHLDNYVLLTYTLPYLNISNAS
jgi:hypothetical protein